MRSYPFFFFSLLYVAVQPYMKRMWKSSFKTHCFYYNIHLEIVPKFIFICCFLCMILVSGNQMTYKSKIPHWKRKEWMKKMKEKLKVLAAIDQQPLEMRSSSFACTYFVMDKHRNNSINGATTICLCLHLHNCTPFNWLKHRSFHRFHVSMH